MSTELDVEKLKVEISGLQKHVDFSDRLQKFVDSDVRPIQKELSQAKMIGGAATFVLSLLGVKAWSDIQGKINDVVQHEAHAAGEFAGDLAVGLSLVDGPGASPAEAIPLLIRALNSDFNHERVNRETIIMPLLHAYDLTGQYVEGVRMMTSYEEQHPKMQLVQSMTLTNLGVLYLGAGLSEPKHLSTALKLFQDSKSRAEMAGSETSAQLSDDAFYADMNAWVAQLALCGAVHDATCTAAAGSLKRVAHDIRGYIKLCVSYWMPKLEGEHRDLADLAKRQLREEKIDCDNLDFTTETSDNPDPRSIKYAPAK